MTQTIDIRYSTALTEMSPEHFQGFFVAWPDPPDAEGLIRILQAASFYCLALDGERVVGFVNAISDGVMTAYIPLLEVLPEYQGHGIGQELIRRILSSLDHLYMVDLCCDPELKAYYQRLGGQPLQGIGWRHYSRLSELKKKP